MRARKLPKPNMAFDPRREGYFETGLIRRMGNGEKTNIWTDNWIPRDVMMRPYGHRSNNPPELLSRLIDHTSTSCDMTKLEEICLPIDFLAIQQIPSCTSHIPKCWAWNFEKNGEFSVRSAYRMMVDTKMRRGAWLDGVARSSSTDRDATSWELLRRIPVSGKIRMFMWRLAKHSIYMEDIRANRNMSSSTACGLCRAEDSWRHSMLECSMARCVCDLLLMESWKNICGRQRNPVLSSGSLQ